METNNVNDCQYFWRLIAVRSDRDEQQKYAGPLVFECLCMLKRVKLRHKQHSLKYDISTTVCIVVL